MSASGREFKNSIYEQLARVGMALSSATRLELLDLLCQSPRTVDELAKTANQTIANASQHLKVLKSARLVEADKSGVSVTYRVANADVLKFFASFQRLGRLQLAEVQILLDGFLEEQGVVEVIDRVQLLSEVKQGKVVVLDVRPEKEYQAAHLPGATSIPLDELERRLSDLPRNHKIVAYCRGPFCVMSIEAVRILKQKGYNAIRLEEGIADWVSNGLPVDRDSAELALTLSSNNLQ